MKYLEAYYDCNHEVMEHEDVEELRQLIRDVHVGPNVRVHDNGAAYMVTVDGLIVSHHSSLGDAWRHIEWMYRITSQEFTVGISKTLAFEWVANMHKQGYLD